MLMDATILLAIVGAVFGVLPLILGSNAVFMFLTLCAGDLLAQLAAKDVTQITSSTVSVNAPMYVIVYIFLLVVASVVLLLLYRKSSGSSVLLQIVPAAAAVVTSFMLITAALPSSLQDNIQSSHLFSTINPFFEFAVAAGLLASVFYLWARRPRGRKHGKKHSRD